MSVRKRTWTTKQGERKEAWVHDYVDGQSNRHIETFQNKKDAIARAAQVSVDVGKGVHTAASKSITVAKAAEDWLAYVRGENRERSTVTRYEQLVGHIVPRLGNEKLAKLTTPRINAFRDDLLKTMSRPTAKAVLVALKSMLKDAKRRGNVAQNVASDISITMPGRLKPKLEIGVDIPTREEIQKIIDAAAPGKLRTLLLTAAMTGMRASELRGLRWIDVDLTKQQIHIRQRADRYRQIGQPKSAAGTRTIPIGTMVVNTLRQWKMQCPKGAEGLVFPTGIGTVEDHTSLLRAVWQTQVTAGVIDGDGNAKYSPHAFRHFYASWCINRRADGGLELPPKTVQARLGHASIVMTLDRYGHLFPTHDDGNELAAAEKALFSV